MRKIRSALIAAAMIGISAGPAGAQTSASTAKGKIAFQSCAACHSDKPGVARLGPSLAGIFGKPSGQVSGFRYSPAMAKAKLTWDRKTLDAYIAKPKAVVPGTTMAYAGVADPAKRQAIIDYLESSK